MHQMCTRKVQDFFQNKDLQFMLQDDYLTISSDRYVLALKTEFQGPTQKVLSMIIPRLANLLFRAAVSSRSE